MKDPIVATIKVGIWFAGPAAILAVVTGHDNVLRFSILVFIGSALFSWRETKEAIGEVAAGLGRLGAFVISSAVAIFGLQLVSQGYRIGGISKMAVGAALSYLGVRFAHQILVSALAVKEPPKAVMAADAPVVAGPPPKKIRAPKPKPAPEVSPPPRRPNPREKVLFGIPLDPDTHDPGFYAICGPPGLGKTVWQRLMMSQILEEMILCPEKNTRLIVFDPKCKAYQWIASRLPPESVTGVPLHLFCPNDVKTCKLDLDEDYGDEDAKRTFSHAMTPDRKQDIQPFFARSCRTIITGVADSIHRRLGTWDFRLLVQILSKPLYVERLLGRDAANEWVTELTSNKAAETAQNIQMSISSILSPWRRLAANLDTVSDAKSLSLHHFLKRRGVLCLQSDMKDNADVHNAVNAMVITRILQILIGMGDDPARGKTFIVIDELKVFGSFDQFYDLLVLAREYNIVFVIAFQSITALMDMWGKEKAESLINPMQNIMILGSGDNTDAEYWERYLGKDRGKEAVIQVSQSSGTNTQESLGGGVSEQREGVRTDGRFTASPLVSPSVPFHGMVRKILKDSSSTLGAEQGPTPNGRSTLKGDSITRNEPVNGSVSFNESISRGESTQRGRSVTYQYFERARWTATEIRELPFPSGEGGFHYIVAARGRRPVQGVLDSTVLTELGIFEHNPEILAHNRMPSDRKDLRKFREGELIQLDLLDDPFGEDEAGPPPRIDDPTGEDEEESPQPSEPVDPESELKGYLLEDEPDEEEE